jgi:hypothetical protein
MREQESTMKNVIALAVTTFVSLFAASAAEAGTTAVRCTPPAVLANCGCVVPPRPVARRAAPVRRVAARPAPVRTRTQIVYRDRPAPAPQVQVVEREVPVYIPAPAQAAPAPRQFVPLTFSNVAYATPQRRAFQMPDVQMGSVSLSFINQGGPANPAPVPPFEGETKPQLPPPSNLPGVTPGVPTPNTPVPPPRPPTDFGGNTGGTTDGGVALPRRNDLAPAGTGGSTVLPVTGLSNPVTGVQNNGLNFVSAPVQGIVGSSQGFTQVGGYQVLPQPQQVLVFQQNTSAGVPNPSQPTTAGQLVFLGQTNR